MANRHCRAQLVLWWAVGLVGCNLGGGVEVDTGAETGAEAGAEAGADADGLVDEDAGDGSPARGGRIVQILSSGNFTVDRLCDLDGDGVGDNSFADLGAPDGGILAGVLSSAVAAALDDGNRLAVDLPWVDDLSGPSGSSGILLFYSAEDIAPGRTEEDDFSGSDAFFAKSGSLTSCGEPLYASTDARLEGGELSATLATVALSAIGDSHLIFHDATIGGAVAPFGESSQMTLCGIVLVSVVGDMPGGTESGLTFLEELLAGGPVFGVPLVLGLTPDVDRDGDGLERLDVDDEGRLTSCVDGDLTEIPGPHCYRDPRMADGFSMNLVLEGVAARFAGRAPGWEYAFGPPCADGISDESLFDSPADSFGACVGFEEQCDPRAPEPCCDPSHVCSGANGEEHLCSEPCEATSCAYGARVGRCHTDGLCRTVAAAPGGMNRCTLGEEGCTTEYGATEGTFCVVRGESGTACFEACDPPVAPCAPFHDCAPLIFNSGGACVARWPRPEA